LTTYTKFTFSEFRVCVRAIFAFGAGYKLGERYELGELERRRGQSADAEAWQLGSRPRHNWRCRPPSLFSGR